MKTRKINKLHGTAILLLQQDGVKEVQTKSKIVIPDSVKDSGSLEVFEGTILQTGHDVTRVVPGELVMFGKNSRATVPARYGEDLILVYERDIIANIEEVTPELIEEKKDE